MERCPVPTWAVRVHVGFAVLVLSQACTVKTAWRLSRGARVSPFHENCLLQEVDAWRQRRGRLFGNIWDAVSLPVAFWRGV
jgi:hypothetical protein